MLEGFLSEHIDRLLPPGERQHRKRKDYRYQKVTVLHKFLNSLLDLAIP
jgi:hypothetical protein